MALTLVIYTMLVMSLMTASGSAMPKEENRFLSGGIPGDDEIDFSRRAEHGRPDMTGDVPGNDNDEWNTPPDLSDEVNSRGGDSGISTSPADEGIRNRDGTMNVTPVTDVPKNVDQPASSVWTQYVLPAAGVFAAIVVLGLGTFGCYRCFISSKRTSFGNTYANKGKDGS